MRFLFSTGVISSFNHLDLLNYTTYFIQILSTLVIHFKYEMLDTLTSNLVNCQKRGLHGNGLFKQNARRFSNN